MILSVSHDFFRFFSFFLTQQENGRAAAKAAAVQAIKREEIRRVQAILPILLAVINQRPTARESCVSALLSHTDHSKAALR
jgi:hypothetical protein